MSLPREYVSRNIEDDKWNISHYLDFVTKKENNKPHSTPFTSLFCFQSPEAIVNETNFKFKYLLISPITNRGRAAHQYKMSLRVGESDRSAEWTKSQIHFMIKVTFAIQIFDPSLWKFLKSSYPSLILTHFSPDQINGSEQIYKGEKTRGNSVPWWAGPSLPDPAPAGDPGPPEARVPGGPQCVFLWPPGDPRPGGVDLLRCSHELHLGHPWRALRHGLAQVTRPGMCCQNILIPRIYFCLLESILN